MYFNISDIKTYNIDESYKQCFSNLNCIIKSDKYINKKDTYDILS